MPINPIGPKPITPKANTKSFERVLSQREKAYLDKVFKTDSKKKTRKPKENLGKYVDFKV